MAERRAVIFGGCGFIGRHLATGLAAAGWTVRVTTREPRQPAFPAGAGSIEVAATALDDERQIGQALRDSEAVINLIGTTRGSERRLAQVHVAGAERIARQAAAAGARRLLHISALGIAADAPSAPDRTKAQGESAVRRAFPAATLVRPSLVYGPGDHFFSRFAALARASPVLPVIGGGCTRFQPMHIDDAVAALAALLERPDTAGWTFALVGPEIFTLRELLQRLLRQLRRRRLFLSLPLPVARALAAAFEQLPQPPLTREEVRLLETDKVAQDLPTPADLGLAPRPLHEGLPASLAGALGLRGGRRPRAAARRRPG